MNRDDLIEAIIKEVKRVLAERGIPVAAESAEKAVASKVSGAPAQSGKSIVPAAVPGPGTSVGTRDLTGRQIITQKDLEAFQGSTIHVTRKAIITPLAVDFARSKGITIVKVDSVAPSADKSVDQVVVAVAFAPNFRGDKSIVTTILNGKGFVIRDFSDAAYDSGIKKLTSAVASGSANFGVLIENSGMEGPIYGNRNDKIRAVHCRTTIDARAARVDYAANVIVIDSTSDPDAVISGFCGM